MIEAIAKTAGIILIAAPEKQLDSLCNMLVKAGIECIQAIDAQSCLAMVRRVVPNLILVDFDLPIGDCRRIIAGLSETVEGRIIPVVLLADPADLEDIKSQCLSAIRDIVFKPIRYEELIARIELVRDKYGKRETGDLDEAGRSMILSARKACHELNQPLQYIIGSIQLALLDISSEDPAYEMMNGLRQQSERMAQITADLMRLIRSI